MQLLLNTLIESGNSNSKEQIEAELYEWLLAKGYTLLQKHAFVLPDELPSLTQVGSGISVFHKDYDINNPLHSTYRRYFLSRCWDNTLPIMVFFGMNPSTASSCSNDPSVEFMMKVARYNECGSLYVINTSPFIKSSKTKRQDFVIDDETWGYIQFAINQAKLIVLAWGENGQRYGIPTITSSYPLRNLLATNLEKLKIFEFGGLNTIRKFPKHPLQIQNKFKEDHKFLTLDLDDFSKLFPIP